MRNEYRWWLDYVIATNCPSALSDNGNFLSSSTRVLYSIQDWRSSFCKLQKCHQKYLQWWEQIITVMIFTLKVNKMTTKKNLNKKSLYTMKYLIRDYDISIAFFIQSSVLPTPLVSNSVKETICNNDTPYPLS
jgi:3-deoxy-D-arabino-heptulosonate 7-phosphate (DAHP) synthase class II